MSAEQLATRLLAALSLGDLTEFSAMLDPEVEIHTARGVRRGPDAAEEWAQNRFEHLERRYVIDEIREQGEGQALAIVRTQYVWRESGLVGDESPVAIELEFRDGRLLRWRYREDLAADLQA